MIDLLADKKGKQPARASASEVPDESAFEDSEAQTRSTSSAGEDEDLYA